MDQRYYHATTPVASREEIVDKMIPYIDRHLARGGRLHQISRHMVGLYHGVDGARVWRRWLSTECVKPGANSALLREILNQEDNENGL